jgi:hypothetical protein
MGVPNLKSPRFRLLRAALSLAVLALVAGLIAACGGGGGSDNAKSTIDDAFSHSIKSANVTLQFSAKINGVQQLQQPVSLKLAGPFQSNGKSKLPSLNWQASFSGAGQSISGGVISTGDNAYVSFQGSNYEVGKDQVAQINQQLASQSGQNKSFSDFGIDPKNWVTNAESKGDENVNGVNTTHVQAGVDVSKMLTDLNKTISQAGGAMGANAPSQLTPQQIDQVKQVVKNPKIDVYVGKDDKILRRLNVSIDFSIPANQRSQFQGAEGGNITFSLDFADVGKPQTVTAPANPKPLSELQGALGGLGGGSGLGGSSSGSGSSGSGSSGSGSGSSNANAQKLQKYSKCLQQADPSDSAAIQKCSELLK